MNRPILAILALSLAIGAVAPKVFAGTLKPLAGAQVAPPTDQAYPGEIRLTVDASDIDRHIVHVKETITGVGSDCVLLHAKWMPGWRGPVDASDRVGGLTISASGSRLAWARNPVDAHAFLVKMPPGAHTLDLQFDYLAPTTFNVGRSALTTDALVLQWSEVMLYPGGYFADRIPVAASVSLPAGWAFATPLRTATRAGTRTDFERVSLELLEDSPIYAGRRWARNDLGAALPADLNLFAVRPDAIEVQPAELERTCCP